MLITALAAVNAAAQDKPATPPANAVAPPALKVSCSPVRTEMPKSIQDNPKFTSATVNATIEFKPPGDVGRIEIDDAGFAALGDEVRKELQKIKCKFEPTLTEPLLIKQAFVFEIETKKREPSPYSGGRNQW